MPGGGDDNERVDLGPYLASVSDEVRAKFRRAQHLIGSAHRPSVGRWHEATVRDLLRQHIPDRFNVGTGFVRWSADCVSNQLDVVIWDTATSAPYLQDGEFVILPPHALTAVLEVKTTLDTGSFKDALSKLHRPTWRSYPNLLDAAGTVAKRPIRAIIAFERGDGCKRTKSVLQKLIEFYGAEYNRSRGAMSIRRRVDRIEVPGSPARDIAEFRRPRFVNLIDAVTVVDGLHIEQFPIPGGPFGRDPAFAAIAESKDPNVVPTAIGRFIILLRDLLARRTHADDYQEYRHRLEYTFASGRPYLGSFHKLRVDRFQEVSGTRRWSPTRPFW